MEENRVKIKKEDSGSPRNFVVRERQKKKWCLGHSLAAILEDLLPAYDISLLFCDSQGKGGKEFRLLAGRKFPAF